MDNVFAVDVLAGQDKLVDVAAGFYLVEALPPAKQITQRLVLADVQHEVNVFGILKVAIKSDNIFVMQ